MPKIDLNVMLLKQDVNFDEPSNFIEKYRSNKKIEIDTGELDAILYHRKGNKAYPPWVKSFESKIGGVDLTERIKKNESHGVSLYLKVSDRIFVINWGTSGRFNTLKDKIDKRFGIYVANKLLNNNSTTQIKSAQSRVNHTNPINKQQQYGQAISSEQISFTMEDNEAFKELNITISDSTDFARMIGKYSSLNVQLIFPDDQFPVLQHLPSKLQELLDIYNSVEEEDIKKLFKGIFPVLDDNIKQALNANLKDELLKDDSLFFLFEKDIDFDFSKITGFKFYIADDLNGEEPVNEELMLSDYISLQDNPEIDSLKKDIVSIVDEYGSDIKKWSIFDCLYGEMSFRGVNYILSFGEWFEVPLEKYQRIRQKIDDITEDLNVTNDVKEQVQTEIEAHVGNPVPKEKIFNKVWCDELNGELFDEASKQITLYEDKFEVCDIFIPEEQRFIHVKFNRGSSTLSHLFNQGFVSATSFAEFKNKYIEKVNQKIVDSDRHLKNSVQDACIHFVILNNKSKDRLPFFSKMALEERVTKLQAYGFTVKLSWIRDAYN